MGLVCIARHVIGCHETQATRVHSSLDDAARTMLKALRRAR